LTGQSNLAIDGTAQAVYLPGMSETSLTSDFLAQKRLAVVGVSRNPSDFSRGLLRELKTRGYDVVPVNPAATEVDGLACYPSVQALRPPVAAALLMTAPGTTDRAIEDCAQAGVKMVWLHRGAGKGAVSDNAVELCRKHGIQVVPGACPYMFLPNGAFFHRVHGFFARLFGQTPS
jgi:hypothetical protein